MSPPRAATAPTMEPRLVNKRAIHSTQSISRPYREDGATRADPCAAAEPAGLASCLAGSRCEIVQAFLDADGDGAGGDLTAPAIGTLYDRAAHRVDPPCGDDESPHDQQRFTAAVAGRDPVRTLGSLGESRVAHLDGALLGRIDVQANHEMSGVIRAPGGRLAAGGQGSDGVEVERGDEPVVDEVSQGRAVDARDTCGKGDREGLPHG